MDPILAGLIGSVIVGLLAMTPPLITAIAALRKANETHNLVNSRMSEILALAKEASLAQGRVEGIANEKDAVLLEAARTAIAVKSAVEAVHSLPVPAAPISVEQPISVVVVEPEEEPPAPKNQS